MEILGLVFAGTATPHRAAMAAFARDVLGLAPDDAGTPYADIFTLPDGSGFAVSDEREPGGGTSRTIGFLVADLGAAVAELAAAGVDVQAPAGNDSYRYAHVVAPDGALYELVERR
ncbi:MAG TPA: VOC family protein [Actinomycetes bacterium]|jgi:catechol 2,3-dioxygenase-like lactoylglutathione lyase family enzyme|nr:VOC family protein [Actinomycetes bacterium]